LKISDHIKNLNSDPDYNYVYVISEIGINHNGCLKTAISLIEASHAAGVDAVKFQKRNLNKIYTEKVLSDPNSAEWNIDYLIPVLEEVELTKEDYYKIKEKCKALCLELIITPFDNESAKFCNELDAAAFKIGSADMVNYELIDLCQGFDRPLIISTGMWEEEEIKKSIDFYNQNFKSMQFFMLLANSTYPTPFESINLKFLTKLSKLHKNVGYSGHERGVFIPVAAQALGATIIEKHITFDRSQTGPDHKASMLPVEFEEMVSNIRNTSLSLGKNKVVNQAEKLAKESFAKSAYAINNIPSGHVLKREDVEFKSPGKGIHPHQFEKFIGKKIMSSITAGTCISDLHFEPIVEVSDWSLPSYSKPWGVKCRFHDFSEYKALNSPVVEFHCSETDLNVNFNTYAKDTQLVMHAPEIFGRHLVDICSDDKFVVEESIELLQKSIDKTLSISKYFNHKKPKFVVHLGGMSLEHVVKDRPFDLFLERAVDNFKKLRYNSSDIEIIPENLPPRPWYLGGQWFQYGFMRSDDMISFCNHFDLKMTFDVCHAKLHCNHDKISLEEYTEKIMHLVSHLHLSDARGIDGEGHQIGEGNIDFDLLFDTIEKSKNSDYTWVTEIWSGHLNHGAGCRKSMHNLAKYNKII
jgi:sialic acid synthase SpsE/sugar phosphate isomerase/epimerase